MNPLSWSIPIPGGGWKGAHMTNALVHPSLHVQHELCTVHAATHLPGTMRMKCRRSYNLPPGMGTDVPFGRPMRVREQEVQNAMRDILFPPASDMVQDAKSQKAADDDNGDADSRSMYPAHLNRIQRCEPGALVVACMQLLVLLPRTNASHTTTAGPGTLNHRECTELIKYRRRTAAHTWI
jgi:hypothetical protein